MNITLIALTTIFFLLYILTSRINYEKDRDGYYTDFDFFWLKNCLVFREMEMLFFTITGVTSFFLVENTVWGPVVWIFLALSMFFAKAHSLPDGWSWYRDHCWKHEKGQYLSAFIISVLSSLIWLSIIIMIVGKFVMFVLEVEPWNR